jgi:drug/metabolite transporter (DMT)-like permease
MTFIGEIAALFTSFCWTMSAIGFSNATRQFGSLVTNRLRVVLAMVALILINTLLYAKPIPFDAGLSRWGWLTISGIIGLALGDAFLFSCYRHVGPRIGLLLLSLAPIFGATSAWLMFGETLSPWAASRGSSLRAAKAATKATTIGARAFCWACWLLFVRLRGWYSRNMAWRMVSHPLQPP